MARDRARRSPACFRLVAGQRAPRRSPIPSGSGAGRRSRDCSASCGSSSSTGRAGSPTAGLTPHSLAIAVLVYTAITFVGMALFGIETWMRARRDVLGLLRHVRQRSPRSRSATATLGVPPLADRLDELGGAAGVGRARAGGDRRHGVRRRPGGAAQGADLEWLRAIAQDAGVGPSLAARRSPTRSSSRSDHRGLVAGVYWLGIRGMQTVRGLDMSLGELGRVFVHSFIPIVLAYLVAHYFSLLRVPGAGPVHLPAHRPARRRLELLRDRQGPDRLRADRRQRSSGTSRSPRWSSATSRRWCSPTTRPWRSTMIHAPRHAPSTGCSR